MSVAIVDDRPERAVHTSGEPRLIEIFAEVFIDRHDRPGATIDDSAYRPRAETVFLDSRSEDRLFAGDIHGEALHHRAGTASFAESNRLKMTFLLSS
jgi:hypothetical protein